MRVLLDAIERTVIEAGAELFVSREGLIEALRSTLDWPGITGAISFDAQGNRLP
jgi:hypothetical protein